MSKRMNADATDHEDSLAQVALPWHYTLGRELLSVRQDTAASSAELNRAAGLDWRVYQTPGFFFVGQEADADPRWADDGVVTAPATGDLKLIGSRRGLARAEPDYLLNVRDDTHDVVGVVKNRYRVLQNQDAPLFLDRLVESGDATFESAGALHGGARVFWLVKLDLANAGSGIERLDTYLLLENSHDGSTSFALSVITTRPASQTTLVWRLPSAPRTVTLRHTDTAKHQQVTANRALELGRKYAEELRRIRDQMLETQIDDERLQQFLGAIVPTPRPIRRDGAIANQRGITMAENTKGVITQIYHHNETQEAIRGTLWGLVQACQFYADHLSINRHTPDSSAAENRLKRLFSGDTLGAKALARALTLV